MRLSVYPAFLKWYIKMRRIGLVVVLILMVSFVGAVCDFTESEPNDDFPQADYADASSCWQEGAHFSGELPTGEDVDVFEVVGPFSEGERVSLTKGILQGFHVVTLFNTNNDMIFRTYMTYISEKNFVLRDSSQSVYFGVMPPIYYEDPVGYGIILDKTFEGIPEPRPQRVLLDFDGANGVVIHSRPPIDIPPLEESWLADEYPGQVGLIKETITNTMINHYAGYGVTIYTTDGVSPQEPYSTVYFGGSEPGLLGLADNVDQYNEDLDQNAIVYVENFAPYWTMQLNAEEMAVMISNVGSHELGHLLGLYHVADGDALMDTTGSAWDLAGEQWFKRAVLETSVFRTGYQNSPYLLELTTLYGEEGGITDCSDGEDNDGDGLRDYGEDPQCFSFQDEHEDRIPVCQDGWEYFPQINKCVFNGYDLELDYSGAESYCSNAGGWLASVSELNPICNTFDLREGYTCGGEGYNCMGYVRTSDFVSEGYHSVWHDLGFHFSSPECGDVVYDFCGTSSMNTNCEYNDISLADDRTDYGFVCLDEPEYIAPTHCSDRQDNDGDLYIDYLDDPGCSSLQDSTETPFNPGRTDCSDGEDNDGDGLIDMNDPSCEDLQDNDELYEWFPIDCVETDGGLNYYEMGFATGTLYDNSYRLDVPDECIPWGLEGEVRLKEFYCDEEDGLLRVSYHNCPEDCINGRCYPDPQCNDGIDNDNDGATDFPADFSCSSLQDDDEEFPKADCQDGIDNDGDGLIDMDDPSCEDLQDNDELYEWFAIPCVETDRGLDVYYHSFVSGTLS
ncbi:MAG: matrixin family metalloprotease, partial [Nanoarchaeota archaeon]